MIAFKRLLEAPHRLFFFTGVVQLLLASGWWIATLALRARGIPAPVGEGLDAPHVHAFLMIYAFLPLFIFGFLFTAGPRWLDLPPPAPRDYIPPGVAACVSALLLHAAMFAGATVFAAAVLLYLGAWAWMLARFVGMIRASRTPDRRHAMLAAGALALGACGVAMMAAWALTGDHHVALAMIMIGLWGFLVPLFCIVCHRMIPFFTGSVLPFIAPWRPMWTLAALIGGSLAHGAMAVTHQLDAWTWLVDLPMGVGAISLAVRWGIAQSFANRLLAMLHVGFAWLGLAYLAHAAQSLLRLFGIEALGLAPVHAVTMGFLASTTVGMVSRVSCGHSGRTLAADRLTWLAFWLLQSAVVLRVGADIWRGAYGGLVLGAAVLWFTCFAAWSWRYLPVYWRPRADGRPG
ncbi:NnrS family protein [Usitatibacter palustris]|uniref:NnrS family protein n=1 Tax=Usitatibacter palustris TaxID=2732487 RepID=A0A6M4H3U3_9PROT|nr:NnrS family protein [Usitatibacter palustris]QJR14249.1 hypothetical protein DSM104440_01042 [Usitatibacter palustris]